jgi:ribonuclease D
MNINYCKNDIPDSVVLNGDVAIDTETMGLNVKRDRLCMIQICDSAKNVYLIHFPNGEYDYTCNNIKKILLDKNRQKIFHYGRFDIATIRYYLDIDAIPNVYCTKIASRFCRTYTESHGLRNLISDLLSKDIKKDQQQSNWGSPKITEEQKQYAANDVIYLHALRDELNRLLKFYNRVELAQKYFDFLDTVCSTDLVGFHEDLFRHS